MLHFKLDVKHLAEPDEEVAAVTHSVVSILAKRYRRFRESRITSVILTLTRQTLKKRLNLIDDLPNRTALLLALDLQRLVTESKQPLTISYLERVLVPYLRAIDAMQQVCSAIIKKPRTPVIIRLIAQASPIDISLEGAADALQALKEDIVPWRKKHAKKLAELQEKQVRVEIRQKEAEVLEIQARSEKESAEVEIIRANAEKVRQEARKMSLENEKLELELNSARLQLALDIVSKLQLNLTDAQRLAHAVKLLPSLTALTGSEVEPLLIEE